MKRRLAAITAAAALLALGGAASASASSIVYIKDGNVWLAAPDGSNARQLTTQGQWMSPSQANDGTIVAVHREPNPRNTIGRLYRLDRSGNVIGQPVAAGYQGSSTFAAPIRAEVAPDGSLVAYHYSYNNPYFSAAFAPLTRDSDYFEYGSIGGWFNPSWFDAQHVILFDPGSVPGTLIFSPGPGSGGNSGGSQGWYEDPDFDLAAGEVNRQFDRFAAVTSGGDHLRLYSMSGPPPAQPDPKCQLDGNANEFAEPSWSPDGRQLAFEDAGGISVLNAPSLDDCASATASVVIPGGSDPDWGPAAAPEPGTTSDGSNNNTGTGGGSDRTAPQVTESAKKVKLAIALRRGLKVTVRTDEPGSARVTAALKGKAVASGARSLPAAGAHVVTVKFTKKARRKLARMRSVRLSLRSTVRDAAGNTGAATHTLVLRRR